MPFKVEGIHLLKDIQRPGDWMTKVDLKDDYFSIPVTATTGNSEISLARQDVPVQLPTVWTVVGPVDLYQGHKASSDYSQNTGHGNNHLHRQHPGDGTKQGTGAGAHRVPDISIGEPRLHCQSTEIFDRDPTQEIDFLGLVADSVLMGLRLPGSKIKNIQSDAKALLQMVQPTAREVSRLLGKLTHATHAMRAAPPPSPPILQTPPSMLASCLAASAGLLPALPSNKRGERGFELVGHSPNFKERGGPSFETIPI